MRKHIGTWKGKDEHILIVEKVLGKSLPKGCEIHHIDFDGLNNRHDNLVVCPDKSYHRLLHRRTNALMACGNPDWRKCNFCKQWDDPKNLYIKRYAQCTVTRHRACVAKRKRERYQERNKS